MSNVNITSQVIIYHMLLNVYRYRLWKGGHKVQYNNKLTCKGLDHINGITLVITYGSLVYYKKTIYHHFQNNCDTVN